MWKKARYYRQTRGLLPTLGLICQGVWSGLRSGWYKLLFALRFFLQKQALAKEFSGKTLLIFTPTVEWNDLFARAQQMASAFGRREGCLAVYLSTQRQFDRVCGWQEVRPGVLLANAALVNHLDRLTKDAAVITAVYNLMHADVQKQYRSDRLIYEVVDDLHLIVSPAEDFSLWQARHVALLRKADLAVATATMLYDEIIPHAKKALLLPNAADFAFFSAPAAPDPAVSALRGSYRCVLGYTGALADWFDYAAVRQTAAAHPDWLWVLIGRVIGSALQESGIPALPNVRVLPPVAYAKLPGCLAAMDILTVPFAHNEITQATSPVKLFEYLAAGKPVISADLPESRKYAPVLRYRVPEDWDLLVPQALAQREDPSYVEDLRRIARENTWDARIEEEIKAIELV